ncbi:MAG: hypothetical protein JWR45_463 [Blastococcus sp.]|nr:hypothetical protein [Blastococcus sp.]
MLEGHRVVELAGHAGQLTGRLMADLGAEVIKVEPSAGDDVRLVPPLVGGESLAFRHLNAGKKSVVVDLDRPAGRGVFDALLRCSDVLVTTADAAALERMGLTRPALQAAGFDGVHLSITPFGLEGPRAHWKATPEVAFAAGGLLSIAGKPEGPPCQPPETQAFTFGSLVALVGATSALHLASDECVVVDISLQEALATQEHLIPAWANMDEKVHRNGSQHRSVAPATIYRTSDGFVFLFVSQAHWPAFLGTWPDHPAEFADAAWQVNQHRRDNVAAVDDAVGAFVARFDTAAFTQLMLRAGIPCLPVNSPAAYLNDPFVVNRGTMVAPSGGGLLVHAAPFRIDGRRAGVGAIPELGQHTTEVLSGVLGYELAEVERLRREGAVGGDADQRVAPAPAGSGRGRRPGRLGTRLPLDGIRVTALTTAIAGPLTCRYLAMLGADVVKIESRRGGVDSFRYFGPDIDSSPRFIEMNTNVRSVALDLKTTDGQRLARELVGLSDVFVENLRPGVMSRLGLGHEMLTELRPDLVSVTLPGFEAEGDYSRYPSWGPTLSAFAGLDALWNMPDDDNPVGFQGSYPDYLSAALAPSLVIAALLRRRATGLGARIELSQCELVSFCLGASMADAARGGRPVAQGNQCGTHLLCGVYRCAGRDRWCAISVESERGWQALLRVLGLDTEVSGGPSATAIEARVADWDADDLARSLQDAGVAASVVNTGKDLAADPQLLSRGLVESVRHPRLGLLHLPRVPIHATPRLLRCIEPAPALGEASESVVRDLLGYSESDYRRWVEAGAVG